MAVKIACFNLKGGIGKTTWAVILTQIALMHKQNVAAFDQDEQQNFNSSMFYLKEEPRFKNLFTLRTLLKKEDFDIPADLLIIDCPPGFNERTNLALKNADFVLIPVRPDKYSLMHINNKIIRIAGEHKKLFQFPLVKLGFMEGNIHDKILAARETSKEIADMGYTVIGDLPLYASIAAHLSIGRNKWWSLGLTAYQRKHFEIVYTKLELLYQKLLAIRKNNDRWKESTYNYFDDPKAFLEK